MAEAHPPLDVPSRSIPVPSHLSPQAQAVLGTIRLPRTERPPLDDHEAWRRSAREGDETTLELIGPRAAAVPCRVEQREVAGVPAFVVDPDGIAPDDRRVFLDIHGGGLTSGGGDGCRAMAVLATLRNGVRTWSPDYRMPPDHPYPAALDDCVAVYRDLLERHRPGEITVGGVSAGGNLAAALVLRARDEGLPLPAAVVLGTPELDLTESGDSFHTNLGVDNILVGSLMPANLLYAAGHDLAHPYLSPLFGDFSRGFPPTILTAGTRDLFLSNAVRMHRALRAAGVEAELHLIEGAPHGGFFGAPEDLEVELEVRRFIDRHWD
jgi:epsilon-lactone hydrolase